MRERDNVVIYAYKPFCFSKAERFLLFECGGHSNNKSNENGGLHASKIKIAEYVQTKRGEHHDFIRKRKENI